MNRFPLQVCLLETATRQPTRLLTPLAKAASTPATALGHAAAQARPLHHHTRPGPTLNLRSRRTPRRCPQPQPLHPQPITRSYATSPPTPNNSPSPGEPLIDSVFEPQTSTWQYLVADPATHTAVIIDPVLDYNNTTRTITTTAADALLSLVHRRGYRITYILETHAHADHLTAAFYLQRRLKEAQGTEPLVGIGKRIGQVQSLFGKRYGVGSEEYEGVFGKLWEDDEGFEVGGLKASVMHLPGHTPDHVGYRIGDNVFCGDSLFHPTLGTARCDFPGGSAQSLYHSAKKLMALPDHVKIWTGHDYPVEGERAPESWTSVGEHRAKNKHIRDGISEDEFVEMRSERDKHLAAPRLVHESLQVNIRAGHLPKVDEAGMRTFKLPIKVKDQGW